MDDHEIAQRVIGRTAAAEPPPNEPFNWYNGAITKLMDEKDADTLFRTLSKEGRSMEQWWHNLTSAAFRGMEFDAKPFIREGYAAVDKLLKGDKAKLKADQILRLSIKPPQMSVQYLSKYGWIDELDNAFHFWKKARNVLGHSL